MFLVSSTQSPQLPVLEAARLTTHIFTGVFVACPEKAAESKDYKLYLVVPGFRKGGCTTLEFLVLQNKTFVSTIAGEEGEEEGRDDRELWFLSTLELC